MDETETTVVVDNSNMNNSYTNSTLASQNRN